jgi:hypothetical protein
MNKMLLMLLVVGILVCGMCFSAEAMCEDISFENMDVSEETLGELIVNVLPCGGGDGGGDVPG